MLVTYLASALLAATAVMAAELHVLTIKTPYSTMPTPWIAGEKATITWSGPTDSVAAITSIEIKTNTKWFWQRDELAKETSHALLPLPNSADDKQITFDVPSGLKGDKYFIKLTGVTNNGDLFYDYSSKFTILPAADVVPIEVEANTTTVIETDLPVVIDTKRPIVLDTERPIEVHTNTSVAIDTARPVVVESEKPIVEGSVASERDVAERPVVEDSDASEKSIPAEKPVVKGSDASKETPAETEKEDEGIVVKELELKPVAIPEKTKKPAGQKKKPILTPANDSPKKVNGTTIKRAVNFALQGREDLDYDGGATSLSTSKAVAVLAFLSLLLL